MKPRSAISFLLCNLVWLVAAPTTARATHEGKLQIVLLGDSTTEGSIPRKVAPQGPHLENVIEQLLAAEGDLPPCKVINLGLSGEFIRRLIDSGRYDKVASKLPGVDYVFIRYGPNDVAKRDDFDNNYPKDFRELIARLRHDHPAATLIPMTAIPLNTDLDADAPNAKRMNDLVRQVAAEEKLTLFDIYPRYAQEQAKGPNMLNYRRFPLGKIPAKFHDFVKPFVMPGRNPPGVQADPAIAERNGPMVVVLDNRLDAHFGDLPGWFGDRHPNLAGYHVIGDETAKFLAPLIRTKFGQVKPAAATPPPPEVASADRADRYALEHYLTDIAEEHWSARRTKLANLKSAADVTARASYIRAEFIKAIGGFPETRTPLNARITGTLVRDGYKIEKLIYESLPGFFVTANVYVPTSTPGPFPAILGTSGHAAVGKALPAYQTAFIALAKRGHLVLAYDPPVQGERMEYLKSPTGKPRALGHITPGLQCLLTGGSVARYFLWDGMRAVDYLLTRSDVDPKRLGAAGNSGGGTQSAFLGVVEPRLAAVAPSCYWTSWENLWPLPASGRQDSEQVVPNFIQNGLGFSDLAIAFAPKPILMLTATRDFFPVEGARDSHEQAKPAFALLGAADKLGYFEHDDAHGWSQPRREATCRWFDQWFFGRNDPVTEPADIKPEDAATLQCTTTGDVVTDLQSKTVQMLNQDLAERLLAKRTIKQADNASHAREIVAARLGMKLQRSAPTATVVQRGPLSGYAHEKIALVPEIGINLEVDLFLPPRPAKSRGAVILARERTGVDEPALDLEAKAWVDAGHVVAITPLRGTLVMPEKADGFWQERYRTAMRAILIGKTMPGMRVQDLLAIYDYVSSRPELGEGVVVVGRRNLGVVALYAAALEPKISRVVLDQSLLSYMEIVRAKQYPETVSDLIVPGVLLDFDLPDLADLAGAGRVVLANPLSAAGTPVPLAAATAAFGKNARVVVDPSIALSKLME